MRTGRFGWSAATVSKEAPPVRISVAPCKLDLRRRHESVIDGMKNYPSHGGHVSEIPSSLRSMEMS